jgi:hypothetical protein
MDLLYYGAPFDETTHHGLRFDGSYTSFGCTALDSQY